MKCSTRGQTIVELLVVIAMFGITLSLVTICLHTILRSTSQFRDEEARAAVLLRLDLQFRTDVHEAARIEVLAPNADGHTVQFALCRDDTRIEYRIEDAAVHRLLERPGMSSQREAYRLGNHAQPRFEISSTPGGVAFINLAIAETLGELPTHSPPTRMHSIRATVGGLQKESVISQLQTRVPGVER